MKLLRNASAIASWIHGSSSGEWLVPEKNTSLLVADSDSEWE